MTTRPQAPFPHADLLLWAMASAAVILISLFNLDAVFSSLGIVPRGNDAFYHAARILDAAAGERGFYQFDDAMHVPEGSWVSWPWGYDYLMSLLARVVLLVDSSADPMAILVFVPVAWAAANAYLILKIAQELELPFYFRALVVFGFVLLPTTQTLHAVGQIDHHFMELCFVLLTTLLALRWLKDDANTRNAIALGVTLGVALIFHHALFILQLPLVAAIGLLWLLGRTPDAKSLRVLALSLFVTALLASLPSGPLLDLQFNMTTLSVFHPYIAGAVAIFLVLLSYRAVSLANIALLVVVSAILLVPAAAQILRGADFLSGNLLLLDQVLEMQSPIRMIRENFGLSGTLAEYGLLLLFVPLMIVFCAWRLFSESKPERVAWNLFAIFGLSMMLFQYRLHYFGTVFMLAVPWLMVQMLSDRFELRPRLQLIAGVAAFLIVFRPAILGSLFNEYPVGGFVLYQTMQPLMPALEKACEEDPGIVLAPPQFGHYISYHSKCSVIANNFLISDLHFQKVEEVNFLFTVPAEVLGTGGGDIKYVLTMVGDMHEMRGGKVMLKDPADIANRNPQLIRDLVLSETLPESIEMIERVNIRESEDSELIPMAGLYKLTLTK